MARDAGRRAQWWSSSCAYSCASVTNSIAGVSPARIWIRPPLDVPSAPPRCPGISTTTPRETIAARSWSRTSLGHPRSPRSREAARPRSERCQRRTPHGIRPPRRRIRSRLWRTMGATIAMPFSPRRTERFIFVHAWKAGDARRRGTLREMSQRCGGCIGESAPLSSAIGERLTVTIIESGSQRIECGSCECLEFVAGHDVLPHRGLSAVPSQPEEPDNPRGGGTRDGVCASERHVARAGRDSGTVLARNACPAPWRSAVAVTATHSRRRANTAATIDGPGRHQAADRGTPEVRHDGRGERAAGQSLPAATSSTVTIARSRSCDRSPMPRPKSACASDYRCLRRARGARRRQGM